MTYLDCNATTPIEPAVLDAMLFYLREEYGNAGSRTHARGRNAGTAVKAARAQVARSIAADSDDVVFTSGATEANNLAILGLEAFGREHQRMHIVTSAIEHKAVLEPVRWLATRGFSVDVVAPDANGRVQAASLLAKVRPDTLLISLMHANNETGVVQPILEVAEALAKSPAYFHVDAAQSLGKYNEPLAHPRLDMLSLSAHKVYGPKGVGALVLRKRRYKRAPLAPLMVGGGQERGLRPGTLPVPLIAGFGVAAELAVQEQQQRRRVNESNRQGLMTALRGIAHRWNGTPAEVLPHVANLVLPGIDSEALMVMVKEDLAFSNGAACTSHSYEKSHVLQAMGLSDPEIASSIRLSWSHFTPNIDWSPLVAAIRRLCAQQVST